jgi:hypothetical protein
MEMFSCYGSACPVSDQFDHHAAADHGRGALQAGKRDVIFRIEEAVDLRAAGLEHRSHAIFGDFLFLHGLFELPGDDLFDRLRLRLLKNAFFFQEIVNARTHVVFPILALLAH